MKDYASITPSMDTENVVDAIHALVLICLDHTYAVRETDVMNNENEINVELSPDEN